MVFVTQAEFGPLPLLTMHQRNIRLESGALCHDEWLFDINYYNIPLMWN
ncbi:hypothetical protein H8E77_43315 [bacterium]|nr:hypothetical protein [bacterium]